MPEVNIILYVNYALIFKNSVLIIDSVFKVLTNKVPYDMVYLLDLLLIELMFVKSIQRKLGPFASIYNIQ